jgi:hypothetical protein
MPDDTDLATGIAQNIGYMPVVNKIGQAGSGFMDFLGSLLGGGNKPATSLVAPQPKANVPAGYDPQTGAIWEAPHYDPKRAPPSEPSFLGGLWDAIKMGGQSTADAFQQDIQDIQNRRLPRQAMEAGKQVVGAMGQPAVTPTVPAMEYVTRSFDPAAGWIESAPKVVPGGNWLDLFTRQGNLGPLLEALLKFQERTKFTNP